MLRKCLVIGLGGSGEKFVRYLHRELERRLSARGWKGQLPAGWRMLCIDIAERPDVVEGDVPGDLGRNATRLGLARFPLAYRTYFELATRTPDRLDALVNSLTPADAPVPDPFLGAGQRPQVGNVVGLTEIRTIADSLMREVKLIEGQEASDDLARLARELDEPDGTLRPSVIVVSSLAGGSGAGLLQLTIELLLGRAAASADWLRTELTTVLFTPDTFADLTQSQLQGAQANALHTICTLLNGFEAKGPTPDSLSELLASGGAILRGGRRAAARNMFVGSGNGEFSFDHQNKVIQATAKALGRLLTDGKLATGYRAHLDANAVGATVESDFAVVDPESPDRPASSLGYASVTLGHALVAEYASQRLAKRSVQRLLRGHLAKRGPGKTREDKLIERLAQAGLARFVDELGLQGQAAYEQLSPGAELDQRARAAAAGAFDALMRDTPRATGRGWRKLFDTFYLEERKQLEARERDLREDAAADWCARMTEHAERAAMRLLCASGVAVAAKVLADAQTVARGSADELDREREEKVQTSRRARGSALQMFDAVSTRQLQSGCRELEEAGDQYMLTLLNEQQGLYHRLGAELLRAFAEGVLQPLQHAIERAGVTLSQSERRTHRALIEQWPERALPPRLRPAPNERLLISMEQVPELVERLIGRTFGIDAPENALDAAVTELLSDDWRAFDDDGDGLRDPLRAAQLLRTERSWGREEAPADYRLALDAPQLLARAEEWIEHRRGALREHLETPIRAWLAASPANADQFAETLDRALLYAAPLVTIDPTVRVRVHSQSNVAPQLYVSPLPVHEEQEIRSRVEQSLLRAGFTEGKLAELFDPGSSADVVEISGFLAQPIHPIVISGLWSPIQRDWQTRSSDPQIREFARYRRTRPLPLFVPLSPLNQLRFAVGWRNARLLGQLSTLDGPWSQRPLRVWTPREILTFPARLLAGEIADDREAFAAVLESLPLAFAGFATGQYDAIRPYLRLIELGTTGPLDAWVKAGVTEEPGIGGIDTPIPPLELVGSRSDTAERRTEATIATLDRDANGLLEAAKRRAVTRDNVATLPRSVETSDLELAAIGVLRRGIGAPGSEPAAYAL